MAFARPSSDHGTWRGGGLLPVQIPGGSPEYWGATLSKVPRTRFTSDHVAKRSNFSTFIDVTPTSNRVCGKPSHLPLVTSTKKNARAAVGGNGRGTHTQGNRTARKGCGTRPKQKKSKGARPCRPRGQLRTNTEPPTWHSDVLRVANQENPGDNVHGCLVNKAEEVDKRR